MRNIYTYAEILISDRTLKLGSFDTCHDSQRPKRQFDIFHPTLYELCVMC